MTISISQCLALPLLIRTLTAYGPKYPLGGHFAPVWVNSSVEKSKQTWAGWPNTKQIEQKFENFVEPEHGMKEKHIFC